MPEFSTRLNSPSVETAVSSPSVSMSFVFLTRAPQVTKNKRMFILGEDGEDKDLSKQIIFEEHVNEKIVEE